MEKNEIHNRVFLFSNSLGAVMLNNCDVSWLLYCSDTKSFCLIKKGNHFTSQLFKMAAPGKLKKKYAIVNFVFLHYRHSSGKKLIYRFRPA